MDPYLDRLDALLGGRDPIDTLRATPARLDALAGDPFVDWDRPWRPDGWTGRQIVAHLCDHEVAFAFHARQLVAAGGAAYLLQPHDQDAWARDYARMDPALAVAAFVALRFWNLAWLARRELADWLSASPYSDRAGEQTLDEAVRALAGHDLNHLAQLDEAVGG